MTEKVEKAIDNHKNFYSCSAALLCAFADEIGLSEQEARTAAAPFAGGRMGKCGAVLNTLFQKNILTELNRCVQNLKPHSRI